MGEYWGPDNSLYVPDRVPTKEKQTMSHQDASVDTSFLFFFLFFFVSTEVCPDSPHTEGSLRGLEVSKYMPPEEVPDLCGLAVKVVFRIWVVGLDLADQLTIRPQYKVKFKEALIKY